MSGAVAGAAAALEGQLDGALQLGEAAPLDAAAAAAALEAALRDSDGPTLRVALETLLGGLEGELRGSRVERLFPQYSTRARLLALELELRGAVSCFRGAKGLECWQYVWLDGAPSWEGEGCQEPGGGRRRLACHGSVVVQHALSASRPAVRQAEPLLGSEAAAAIVALAAPLLHPSRVVSAQGEGGGTVPCSRTKGASAEGVRAKCTPGRTSHSCKVAPSAHPALRALVQRCAFLLGTTPAHAEPVQVLRYLPGQQYRRHFDFFAADGAVYAEAMAPGGRGQRVATAFVYLSDVEKGGTTTFHNARPKLKVAPKLGRGVLWRNVAGEPGREGACLEPDTSTLHSGDPVIKGEKWAVNIFFRERPRVARRGGPAQAAKKECGDPAGGG